MAAIKDIVEPIMIINDPIVYFKCFKEGSKLRIRIISPGYHNNANCQFPRDIRKVDQLYSSLASNVSLACGKNGKYFYRCKKGISPVNAVDVKDAKGQLIKLNKLYEEDDKTCIICLCEERSRVIVPCGHYSLCQECADKSFNLNKKCPLCRCIIDKIVTIDMIQL